MYKLTIEFETAAALAAFVDVLNHDENEDAPAVPGAPAAAPKPRGRKPKAGAVDPALIANPPAAGAQPPVFSTAGTPMSPIGFTPALPSAGLAPAASPIMPAPSIAGIPMAGPAGSVPGSAPAFTPPAFQPAPPAAGYAPAPAAPPVAGAATATVPASPAPSPSSLPAAGPPVQSAAAPNITYQTNILPLLQRIGTEKGRATVEALAQRYGVASFPELPPALFGDFMWYAGMILNQGLNPAAGTQAQAPTPGAMY